jgi:hypothetical protein
MGPSADFVSAARWLPSLALHQFVERGQVGTGASLGEIDLGLEHCQLFSHGDTDELIDADTVFFAEALDTSTSSSAGSRNCGRHRKCTSTGSTSCAKPSRKTPICRVSNPAACACSGRKHTASYSMNRLTLAANSRSPRRAQRRISADAPVGLCKAATMVSVSIAIFIDSRYHRR